VSFKPQKTINDDKQHSLDKIKTDPKNPKTHDARNIQAITKSLINFGQHRPIVVQKSTNIIIVGNGMYQAMRNLGWSHAWVVFVDDDNAQAIARKIADNKTSELGSWDTPVLEELVAELSVNLEDFEIPGFDKDELLELVEAGTESLRGIDSMVVDAEAELDNYSQSMEKEENGLDEIRFDKFNEFKLVLTKEEQSIIEQFFKEHKGTGRPEKYLIAIAAESIGLKYVPNEDELADNDELP